MSAFKDWLNGLTSKTTPVDADELYVRDSSGTPGSKKLTWANVKATLASTFLSLTGGTVAGGTRTTSGSTLTITETLNNAAVTFPGALVVDVTDTASNSASLLVNLKKGGSSQLQVSKNGRLSPSDLQLMADKPLAWTNSNALGSNTGDHLRLYRESDGVMGQRNGTNAQTQRWYGTYTDASNYRRVVLAMTTAGVATLTPEGAGTGASGNVLHISGLPTSNPGAGILWNDSGTVKVGT